MILKNDNLFGKVEDFFFTTEFQQRGNEHEHGLLWIQNAPVYGQNTNAEITSFVDCYISTYSTLLNENFVKVQTHCHTRTCKKHKQSRCRFNFPLPPIDTTMVLEPLENSPNCLIEKANQIYFVFEHSEYSKKISFASLLQELQIPRDEYIFLLHSLLTRPTWSLKRALPDIWINAFTKAIPVLW